MTREGVVCNNCYEPLTEEELKDYDVLWQYSGDMYCFKCRRQLGTYQFYSNRREDRLIETFIEDLEHIKTLLYQYNKRTNLLENDVEETKLSDIWDYINARIDVYNEDG